MNVRKRDGWADRLGSTARYSLIVIASLLAVLVTGMVAGFSYAVYEDGGLPAKPLPYLVFAAIIGLAAIIGWVLAVLIRSIRPETMSKFDRRYWKMWAVVVGLSLPIGIGLAALGTGEEQDGMWLVLSNAPIAASTAIVTAVLLVVLLAAAAIYYHRTVDDHEERAYLWGSTIAFYFLITAVPLHWLLARGAIVPPLTVGSALLLVLGACIVQAIAWAVLKFR